MGAWLKWLALGLALSIVVLAALGAGGYLWLRGSLPRAEGEIALAGLSAPVEIVRDVYGIPHIFAQSADDAFFGLGFAHAQDRLWQMEMQRRVGAGRLSEIFGARTLEADRFLRVLGVYRAAQRSWPHLSPETRAAYEAYAAGVNGFLTSRSGALPPEFVLLGVEPEPWVPADSLVWIKLMAWDLGGNWRDDLLRARIAARLGLERATELWPSPGGEAADLPAGTSALYRALPLDALARTPFLLGPRARGLGSNAWAVAPGRSASGAALLANDPHLDLEMPTQWYLAQLSAPGLEVIGATLPGLPAPVLGRTERIAWGFTNTDPDVQDLFIERLDPGDSNRYLTPDGHRPFATRSETIRVRGGRDETLVVRESRHGPIISDVDAPARETAGLGQVLALAWTALDADDRSADAGLGILRARNWTEFTAALRDFAAPQQNVVYADVDGNIGFIAAGRVPIRARGRGRFPVPGWTGAFDWIGVVPFEALPRSLNPASGRIVTANQRVVDDAYSYFITDDWAPPFRARRIARLLDAEARHTPASFAAIQLDIRSGFAAELLPLMLARATPSGPRAEAALARLADWDRVMAANRPEPLIFAAWQRALVEALFADELGPLWPEFRAVRPTLTARVLAEEAAWCDDVTTPAVEDCAEIVSIALDAALDQLARAYGPDMDDWRWGDAHRIETAHKVLARVPILGAMTRLDLPNGGGRFTVNAATYRLDDEAPFRQVVGPGYRAIYDLGPDGDSAFVQNLGQSGNPFSEHFDDLAPVWHQGAYLPMATSREKIDVAGRLVLRPE